MTRFISFFAQITLLVLFSWKASSSQKIVYLEEGINENMLAVYDVEGKTYQRVFTAGLQVIYPDISKDGKLVAFSGSKDGLNFGIFIFDLINKDLKELVPPNGLTIQPTFSGNGRWLAYSAPIADKGNQIHLLNLEDLQEKSRILPTTDSAFYPCLSSSGSQVTFHLSNRKETRIAIFDLKNEKLHDLKIPGKAPCFSADDEKIVFVQQTNSDWNVFSIKVDGSELSQLTNSPAKDYAPRWMIDGSILFSSNRAGGQFRFYRFGRGQNELKGDVPVLVLQGEKNIWDPRVSGSTEFDLSRLSDIAGDARSSFGALRHEDSIFIIGGHKGNEHTYPESSFSNEVHAYSIRKKTWRKLADKIFPVHGVTAAAYGRYVYAFGGFAFSKNHNPGWKSLDVIERYDIVENKWSIVGQLPRPRSSNAIVKIDSKVFLVGGWDATPKFDGDKDGTFHNDIIEFDLITEKVSIASFPMATPLRRAFTGVEYNGAIIIAGGITQGGNHFSILDDVMMIDPKKGVWAAMPKLPFPNFAPAIEMIGSQLFMFGGMTLTNRDYTYVNQIHTLKPGMYEWEQTGRYLSENKGFLQAIKLSEETVGLLGGHTYDNQVDGPVKTFEVFSRK